MLLARADDGSVTAVCRDDRVGYEISPDAHRVLIAGASELAVNQAAARVARDAIRVQLHIDGWTLLHASAVTRGGRTVLCLGGKGAGKTSVALTLARHGDWGLLANDRVFARAHHLGVQILSWPAAAAIGLGLLNALGWFDLVRDRLMAGEHLHPTQHEWVTEALLAGHCTPLFDEPGGRELKAHVFPAQLISWLDMRLASSGHAATLLFPTITPGAAPELGRQRRGLTEADFFTPGNEDRYPDIFGLCLDPAALTHARNTVGEQLAHLPHRTLTLGHDVTANAAALTEIVAP